MPADAVLAALPTIVLCMPADAVLAANDVWQAELCLSSEDLAGKLCSAGAAGDCALVRRYLAAGADPDASDYDARTALMLAAAEG